MQREIRRYSDYLVSIGTGVALFGIWTVVRMIMGIILERETIIGEMQGDVELSKSLIFITISAILVLLSLFILSIHMYIGLSARSEGLGLKKKNGYLIATVVYTVIYCIGIISEILFFQGYFKNVIDGVVTIIIDITMLITFVELMINAIRVRKLSGKLTEAGGKNAG